MAITKTKFINYIRCPRYVALDDLNKEKLNSNVSFDEYQEELKQEKISEIISSMYDSSGNDLLILKDEQLEVMLPYYKQIEIEASNIAKKHFKGDFRFAYNTTDQESFDAYINKIRYICYVDIYNEYEDAINIIEVKATTSKKFFDLKAKKDDTYNSIFKKKDGIYYLLEDLNVSIDDYMKLDKYYEIKSKLFDKYSTVGNYVYDLAIQRYIIENDLKQHKENKNVKYYLALLNDSYVFDGTYENNKPLYQKDKNGNDIVCFFDMTSVTKDYLDIISKDFEKLEKYIDNLDASKCNIGPFCEYKKRKQCRYLDICFNFVPKKNSILNLLDSHQGFKDKLNNKYDRYDLINSGIVSILDIDYSYLNREKNKIQKQVVETNIPYINKNKIIDGIKEIKYPIYHLDFETFPCPLPRFKGEKPYTQSVFQFSLHIEKEKGMCDKEKDHYGYLAKDNLDHREELIKELLKHCDVNKGTVLVYNDSFEKTRLKELAEIFVEYKDDLLKLNDRVFDLMNIVKTKTSLYEKLGYSKEEASLFNYYHKDMNGSFSIKKILPLFSDLKYDGMEISNGVEALVTYAKFNSMNEKEFDYKYQKLVEYCAQDTWAMVMVLQGLQKIK